jgi:hypothetical protein
LAIPSEDWLLERILSFGDEYSMLFCHIHFEFVSLDGMRAFLDRVDYNSISEELWERLLVRLKGECDREMQIRRFGCAIVSPEGSVIDSRIIFSLPSILSVFSTKTVRLLYRGSRDGLSAAQFHKKCDGIGSTFTLIETSRPNIFGGYTLCVWSSTAGNVYDTSGRSFIFTLKNPHNLAARKFNLMPKQRAIFCGCDGGPSFGSGIDIRVLDNCNSHKNNYLNVNGSYLNDTEIDSMILLDGECYYTVHEIEVFAISE